MNQSSLKDFFQIAFRSKVKVTLLFLLSFGIPSAFLLFLAIRGIENDRALLEQRLLAEHNRIANSLVAEVENVISSVENDLIRLLDETPDNGGPDRSLSGIGFESSLLVDEVFLIQGDDLVYPGTVLLYSEGDYQPSGQNRFNTQGIENTIAEAERNEFQLKDYNRALELYSLALGSSVATDVKADLRMRLARVYIRRGEMVRAIETFDLVAQRFANNRLPGGLPGGLVARLESVKLIHQLGDSTQAKNRLVDLFQKLLNSSWSLSRTQFRFVRSQIETLASELAKLTMPDGSNSFHLAHTFRERADSLVIRTDYLLAVKAGVLSIVLDSTGLSTERATIYRSLIFVNLEKTMLVIAKAVSNHNDDITAAGTVINQTELVTSVLPNLIDGDELGDNAALLIKSENGATIYGESLPVESRRTVTATFKEGFPPWRIELYQIDPDFFESLISGQQSFYIYSLITVMLAMIFGAIMTTRMMSRELELARMKSDFVSTVSHEFRSPLTSIRQLAEMLGSDRVSSEERRKRYYDVILEQSERLSLLVSNILDLARIDEQRFNLEYEEVDISQLLNTIVVRARKQGGEEGIAIRLNIDDELPPVSVDPDAITHIMTNLIDNAIKYSNESPDVAIGVKADGRELVITVSDKGIGIPKGEIDKVFERFYRVGDEFTRKVKGSGLGLALVRELVQAHSGTIKILSEPKRSSTFTIRLPMSNDKENNRG